MGEAESLRRQSLEMMDKAVAANGTERLVFMDEALRLHALAREAEASDYPPIPDVISPVAGSNASDDEELNGGAI